MLRKKFQGKSRRRGRSTPARRRQVCIPKCKKFWLLEFRSDLWVVCCLLPQACKLYGVIAVLVVILIIVFVIPSPK
jgi:hypothetical protein